MNRRRNAIYFLIILTLVLGWWTGRNVVFNMAYVFGLVLIFSLAFSWTSVNWLKISRQTVVRRTQVGQYFEEAFSVENKSYLPKLWLELRDFSDLPGHNTNYVVPSLLPRRGYRWRIRTLCTRRGQFTLGPMTLSSGDPFGFFVFPRHIAATSTILVYPATVPIYQFATSLGALSGGQAIRKRTYEVTTNASGIRDYAPGDSLNRIHWKSSARRNKLLVKEFELDPLGDIWILLDLSRESLVEGNVSQGFPLPLQGGVFRLPPSSEEYCITAAASIAQYFLAQSRSVGFLSYTPHRDYISPDRGDRQLTRILEVLATARSETDITLRQMISLESPHLTRGTTLVVVTSSTRTDWAAEAHVQSRRGISVISVLVDPTSFGLSGIQFKEIRQRVETAGVLVYPLRQQDDLTSALSYRPGPRVN